MIPTWKNIALYVCFFICLSACGQPTPIQRPELNDPQFDKMLTRLLPFYTPLIGVHTLREKQDSFIVLDARSREEYRISHIPQAIWVGYGKELKTETLHTIPKNKPVAVYCSVGYRSDFVGKMLVEKLGFTKVYNVYGSIFEWSNQGFPLEDDSGSTTKRLHTYNSKWSKWVSDTLAIEKIW